jgi:type II secretory pathway pseudopilin PulG
MKFPRLAAAFTLIEILISILILALGMLGLGVLFPVIIREQRIGTDAVAGVAVANNARAILTSGQWAMALKKDGANPHPAYGVTPWLWVILRDSQIYSERPQYPIRPLGGLGEGYTPNNTGSTFQKYAQGEWFTDLVNADPANTNVPVGTAAIGYPDGYTETTTGGTYPQIDYQVGAANHKVAGHVNLSVAQRLYPVGDNVRPQYVWDFAVQRRPDMNFRNAPYADDLRAVVFVRAIDPRLRLSPGTSLFQVLPEANSAPSVADQRVPVGEDANGNPTLDGTNGDSANPGPRYSTIKTCEVEFFYKPDDPAMNHPDRLYLPNTLVNPRVSISTLKLLFSQMKQPGQKLVDNLGNVYTVVGSGNESGVNAKDLDGDGSADYVRVDPPVPVGPSQASPAVTEAGATYPASGDTVRRAIWQVCFTPQVPVAVSVFDLFKGNGQ